MPRWPLSVLFTLRCWSFLDVQPQHARLEELPVWLKVSFLSSAFPHSCCHCLRARTSGPSHSGLERHEWHPPRRCNYAHSEQELRHKEPDHPQKVLSRASRIELLCVHPWLECLSAVQVRAMQLVAQQRRLLSIVRPSVRRPAPAALRSDVRSALTPSPVDAAQRLEVHFHPRRDVRRA